MHTWMCLYVHIHMNTERRDGCRRQHGNRRSHVGQGVWVCARMRTCVRETERVRVCVNMAISPGVGCVCACVRTCVWESKRVPVCVNVHAHAFFICRILYDSSDYVLDDSEVFYMILGNFPKSYLVLMCRSKSFRVTDCTKFCWKPGHKSCFSPPVSAKF